MNKKALGMEMFNLLIAAAVIASAFFIFYTWYGVSGNEAVARIDAESTDIQKDSVLISLLNTPFAGLNVADLLATQDPRAKFAIEQTLQKVFGPGMKYRLVFDGSIVSGTAAQPISPVEQYAVLPVPDGSPKNVILRFGI